MFYFCIFWWETYLLFKSETYLPACPGRQHGETRQQRMKRIACPREPSRLFQTQANLTKYI